MRGESAREDSWRRARERGTAYFDFTLGATIATSPEIFPIARSSLYDPVASGTLARLAGGGGAAVMLSASPHQAHDHRTRAGSAFHRLRSSPWERRRPTTGNREGARIAAAKSLRPQVSSSKFLPQHFCPTQRRLTARLLAARLPCGRLPAAISATASLATANLPSISPE